MSSDSTSSVPAAKEARANKPDGKAQRAAAKRVPFGGRRARLEVPPDCKDPGYHYAWFRDQGDNLYRVRAAAYEEVSFADAGRIPPKGSNANDPCIAHGGVGEAGVPYNMWLMRIPMEFYREDQAAHDKLADDIDKAVFRKEYEGNKYGHHSVSVKDEE